MPLQILKQIAYVLDLISGAISGIGKIGCWLILPILIAVLFSVGAGIFRTTDFANWETPVFLFGTGISLNALLELQWHLFGAMLMLTGAYALNEGRHVQVDLVSASFSPRFAVIVVILGDLFFLLPLCVLLIERAMPLVELAYRTGEMSNEDGLTDRWFIKSFVPLGMILLAVQGGTRILRNLLTFAGVPKQTEKQGGYHVA